MAMGGAVYSHKSGRNTGRIVDKSFMNFFYRNHRCRLVTLSITCKEATILMIGKVNKLNSRDMER